MAVTNTTVTLNTSGTAILNSDYSLSSTSLTIPAGSREVKATLQAVSDNIDEAVEKVEVSIGSVSGGNGAKVGGNQVEVSINDFILKAAAKAMKKVPEVNWRHSSHWCSTGSCMTLNTNVLIGSAVRVA